MNTEIKSSDEDEATAYSDSNSLDDTELPTALSFGIERENHNGKDLPSPITRMVY